MLDTIDALIQKNINIELGINKKNEISRLIFEICRRESIMPERIFEENELKNIVNDKNTGYLGRFAKLKGCLLKRRFPNALKEKDFSVFLNAGLKRKERSGKIYAGAFYPERIFIEAQSKNTVIAKRLAELFPEVKTEYIQSLKKYRQENKLVSKDLRKRDIFVAKQNWDFIKACPCTKGVVNCNYHIINLGFGCPFDCTYCYLQQYSNFPGIILDSDLNGFLEKIDSYLHAHKNKTIRLGTGEFTDSLALDDITLYSKGLIPYFADKNILFEMKTKSDNIKNLAGLKHNGKTLISWSLNPKEVAEKEEFGSASVLERLKAAKICYNNGYKIGFHFDPIIHYEGWEKDYSGLINDMCDMLPEIEWISLGTFRFSRSLKPVIEQRFPETRYIYDELIIGHDGKMRYYKALRMEIYKKMISWIRNRNKKTAIYLCMESKDVWDESLGRQKPYWL